MTLSRDILKVARALEEKWYRYRYLDRDIAAQKRDLADYSSGVTAVEEFATPESSTYAAFVYYEPGEQVSPSVQRVTRALKDRNVNTIILCNHELSSQQRSYFQESCHALISRDNQGFDFGAYKDAVKHLADGASTVDRLILLNDSVFYASTGLAEFVDSLLGSEDVIAGYENWGEDHHFQSFALSVSSRVFRSDAFQNFWAEYVPVNNRVHAIENGEKKLTRAVLANAESCRVVYNVAALANALYANPDCLPSTPTVYAQPWRVGVEGISSDTGWDERVTTVVNLLNVTSPIHSGAYLIPRFLHSPLFKKDLVYRGRFQFWEVESWMAELAPPDEVQEFVNILRQKGDAGSLGKSDFHRYQVGAK